MSSRSPESNRMHPGIGDIYGPDNPPTQALVEDNLRFFLNAAKIGLHDEESPFRLLMFDGLRQNFGLLERFPGLRIKQELYDEIESFMRSDEVVQFLAEHDSPEAHERWLEKYEAMNRRPRERLG